MYEARIHRVLSQLHSLRVETSREEEHAPAAQLPLRRSGVAYSGKAPSLRPADVHVMLIESEPNQVRVAALLRWAALLSRGLAPSPAR